MIEEGQLVEAGENNTRLKIAAGIGIVLIGNRLALLRYNEQRVRRNLAQTKRHLQ